MTAARSDSRGMRFAPGGAAERSLYVRKPTPQSAQSAAATPRTHSFRAGCGPDAGTTLRISTEAAGSDQQRGYRDWKDPFVGRL